MKKETHTIDAAGKSLGRIATEAALLLRGKEKPDFAPYKDSGDAVIIKNAKVMKITGKKLEQKRYYRHSGYPGGISSRTLKEVLELKPEEVLRKAVWGMLPKNKLRAQYIKRLRIEL